MKPPPFDYLAPETLEEALQVMEEGGGDAKILAGGQSLIPSMNFRMAQPSMLVDLNNLPALEYVKEDQEEGMLRIGAMTRQSRVGSDPLIETKAPLLHETIPYIAHPQIRNRGTLGGSLVHADPAAELPVIAVALRMKMRLQSVEGGRWVEARDFFYGMFMTDLQPHEILVEVAVPTHPAGTGWAFEEIARRSGDYAMMGVAALVTLDGENACSEVRLVYLNAGEGPVEAVQAAAALEGQEGNRETIESAAIMASEKEIDPLGSVHASVDFQRHLAKVLTERVLERAFRRADGSTERSG